MQFDLKMWKYARDIKVASGDPLRGHEHRPNGESFLTGVPFKTNSKGQPDREIPYERTPGVLRVMMLGDSLTVGWGVPVEDAFSKRVERMYAEKGVKAVINTGVGNYNTIREVQFFLTEGRKYNPDIVVLNFFPNDAEPVPVAKPPNFIERNCAACVFVAGRLDALLRIFRAKRLGPTTISIFTAAANPRAGWKPRTQSRALRNTAGNETSRFCPRAFPNCMISRITASRR